MIKIACVIAVLVVVGNMVKIAVADHAVYEKIAQQQQLSRFTIPANRGTIYDCNMEVLAQSATVWKVVLSPMTITEEDRPKIKKELAKILDISEEKMEEHLAKKNRYEIVQKKVEKPLVDQIRTFIADEKVAGISLEEDTKRYYPNGSFAASVLGFTGDDNQGQYGVEYSYNDYLGGTDGYTVTAQDGKGRDMPVSYERKIEPIGGNNLVLTLDENIQFFLEKALREVMTVHKPKMGAAGIVMDVNTGAVLGMASMNDFDPNNPRAIADPAVQAQLDRLEGDAYVSALVEAQQKQWYNKAISYAYQPGSVFKVVTGSAALEEKVANLNTTFSCPGFITVADRTMKCHNTNGHGVLDFRGGMVNSCNPYFVHLGQNLGEDLFFKYLKKYGLTAKTGIDLPGEGVSQYLTPEQMGIVELSSCAFGQTTAVTPLQMITTMAAVVNGGNLVTPYVVKNILDANGNIVESHEPKIKRQVISAATSETMRSVLESVVSAAGGSNAYIKGYQIGGKSGTSQKQGPDDDKEAKISSYCAFAPADNPEVAVLIMVDEPQSGEVYGNLVAAPVTAQIMGDILPYIGIQQKFSESELETLELSVPNVKGKDIVYARSALKAAGLNATVIGKGGTVLSQVPKLGTKLAANSKVILYTEEGPESTTVVPSVIGLSPAEANQRLVNAGLNVEVNGGAASNSLAKVTKQSIKEGEVVGQGTVVSITCLKTDTD